MRAIVRQLYIRGNSRMDQLIPSLRASLHADVLPEPKLFTDPAIHLKAAPATANAPEAVATRDLAPEDREKVTFSKAIAAPVRGGLASLFPESLVSGIAAAGQAVLQAAPEALQHVLPAGSSSSGTGPVRKHQPLPLRMIEAPTYIDWLICIKVQKYALKRSFYVHFFLGDIAAEPANWLADPNQLGTFTVFTSNPEASGCEKCKAGQAAELLITGVVPLTGALLDRVAWGEIHDSNDRAEMVPYLKKNLRWKVADLGGRSHPTESVGGLRIGVISRVVTKPVTIRDPAGYGPVVAHLPATAGKVAGRDDSSLPENQIERP